MLAALEPASVAMAPGSGPRHLVWHPTLPVCYVVNELLSTAASFKFDGRTGQLKQSGPAVSTLPPSQLTGDGDSTCAAIRIAPDGRSLYCSNRGHDSIARLELNPADGSIQPTSLAVTKCGGAVPRDFVLLDRICIVANQNSRTVTTLARDPVAGGITGHPICTEAAGCCAAVLVIKL